MGATKRRVEPGPARQRYRCFLLRCRLEEGAGPGGEAAWRFTVERAGDSRARRVFASLEAATAYIDDELQASRRSAVGPGMASATG